MFRNGKLVINGKVYSPEQSEKDNTQSNKSVEFTLSAAVWNVNSWTQNNKTFREQILLTLDFDLIGIVESKLANNNEISLPGYMWIGHNRSNLRQNDNGSGGVGLFIKTYLYEIYEISVFDRSFRDVLLSQEFFDYLTNTIFRLNDFDLCLYLGDVNARCGRESDVVAVIDGNRLPDRRIIDETKNTRGPIFMDFLKSVNCCLLNGRVTPDLDNFTCISHKGRSVVDYMFVPYENIDNIEQFAVLPITELSSKFDIHADRGKPNHSILCAELTVSFVNHISVGENDHKSQQSHVLNERMYFKHNTKKMPPNFMASDDILRQINATVDAIEQRVANQENIDSIYGNVCNMYYAEMDEKLKFFDIRKTKRSRRSLKPWKNSHLSELFEDYRQAEKNYLKCTYRAERARLLTEFKLKRDRFDKEYRKVKRLYDNELKIGIAKSETRNPKDFWNKLKSLGRNSSKTC